MLKIPNLVSRMGLMAALVTLNMVAAQADSSPYLPAVKITPLLQSSTTWVGQPIHYPVTNEPEVRAFQVDIPPGGQTGWHYHPVPSYEYVLSGRLTLQTRTNEAEFGPGQAFIESVNMLHNGKNLGTEPVRLIVFYTGVKDEPVTIKPTPRVPCCKHL